MAPVAWGVLGLAEELRDLETGLVGLGRKLLEPDHQSLECHA